MLESAGILSFLHGEEQSAVLKGIFEMTAGINMLGMCSADIKFKSIAASFLVSFGGLSVIGQSVSMVQGSGIRASDIIRIKLLHGLWAGLIAWILCRFI